MVSYYKTADVYIDLYIKGGTKYAKIGSCSGHATDEEAGDYLSVILNPDPQSFKDYTWTASSYSGSIDLYITIYKFKLAVRVHNSPISIMFKD